MARKSKYLNEEQTAQLEQMLNQQEAPASTPEETPAEDTAAVDAAAPAQEPAQPEANPHEALFAELGVQSVEEMAERFKEATSKNSELKGMLSQLLAFQQALDNESQTEPEDPMNSIKKAVREEMAPVYEKLQQEARNKIVQEAWGEAAKGMPDIADVMPEITAYMTEHPELAVDNDGLRRAYDSVRSAKYRTEDQMFSDDEFVKRAAANEKVKDAVLKEHLSAIARIGGDVPASIGNGGGVPLTGQKPAPNSMDQAKAGLGRMLGLK